MNYILFDTPVTRTQLLPLTYFRPVAALRCGIFTLKEKWEKSLKQPVSYLTESYLQEKFSVTYRSDNIYINSQIFPDNQLVTAVKDLQFGQKLVYNGQVLAFRTGLINYDEVSNFSGEIVYYNRQPEGIFELPDIFKKNADQIAVDFAKATRNKVSQKLSETNTVIGSNPVFVEEGAQIEACIINTEAGPVYFGKNVVILEGSMIRGPFAALDYSVVKMGAKIYGGTTLGPHSKVGGELKEVVLLGHANKGHDGYLGDSVIGEWCNLGAGTNNSNLKNNYSNVKLWNYKTGDYVDTGLQFCGMIMGDHSKCGIGTMFNTGTVVGVNSNVFGSGFQPKFFPSFKWGGTDKRDDYRFEKALEVAQAVYKRRKVQFDAVEQRIFKYVYQKVKNTEK